MLSARAQYVHICSHAIAQNSAVDCINRHVDLCTILARIRKLLKSLHGECIVVEM